MKSFLRIFFIAVMLLNSCGDKDKEAQEELYKKVIAVHDEIMPKMGDIMKYKKQLKEKVEELTSAGLEENEAKIAELNKAIEALDNSHEGMMSWMREFNRDFEGMVQEEIMAYLDEQMTKIENVGKTTSTAIKNAQDLLAK